MASKGVAEETTISHDKTPLFMTDIHDMVSFCYLVVFA